MPDPLYPTDPVEIVLADGKPRPVRFPANAIRRMEKEIRALAEDATSVDSMAIVIWAGLIDRSGIERRDCICAEDVIDCKCGSLVGMIDARAIPYLNSKLQEALPDMAGNPLTPAGRS